jgi:hypothetical protein
MTKIYNVGGLGGFGPLDPKAELPGFSADWEARSLALGTLLVRSGLLDPDVVAALLAGDAPSSVRYERFFDAMCAALGEAHILNGRDLAFVVHGE